jgi:hypothetical protein
VPECTYKNYPPQRIFEFLHFYPGFGQTTSLIDLAKKLTIFAHTIKYVIVTYKSNIPLFEEKESIHGETLVEAQLLDQQ